MQGFPMLRTASVGCVQSSAGILQATIPLLRELATGLFLVVELAIARNSAVTASLRRSGASESAVALPMVTHASSQRCGKAAQDATASRRASDSGWKRRRIELGYYLDDPEQRENEFHW
jgi:hypothetical protein